MKQPASTSGAPMADQYRRDLLDLATRFQAATGFGLTTISRYVFGSDSEFITRLRKGKPFHSDKAARLEQVLTKALAQLEKDRAAFLEQCPYRPRGGFKEAPLPTPRKGRTAAGTPLAP